MTRHRGILLMQKLPELFLTTSTAASPRQILHLPRSICLKASASKHLPRSICLELNHFLPGLACRALSSKLLPPSMSRQTPRKARHTRQPSNLIPAVSDYESDAAAVQAHYAPPPPRTNTELNVGVLQRYLPSVQAILSIAANAVVYTFDSSSSSWDKSGVEGTMFVCAQSPLSESHQPRACVFVLNRRALDNLVVDLARVSHVEIAGELVILQVDGNWQEGDKVVGLWIHNDRDETREINGAMIQESWKVARSSSLDEDQGSHVGPEAGPAMQAVGRRLPLSDLFGGQHGH